MFCVMDVSGSMTRDHKAMAKKFFLLLDLFLQKFYQHVEIVYVRYHTKATLCNEQQFYYGTETGGTVYYNAQELVLKTIQESYPPDDYNIYYAHASDGDMWADEHDEVFHNMKKLIDICQYTSYIEIDLQQRNHYATSLINLYEKCSSDKLGVSQVETADQIYPALRELFKKRGVKHGKS